MARKKPKQLRPAPNLYRGKQSKRRDTVNARAHTAQRAAERLGTGLTKADLAQLVRRIERREGTMLEKQSGSRELWLLSYGDRKIPAVYDTAGRTVVTILPVDHPSVVAHIAAPEQRPTGRDPRLAGLQKFADQLGLKRGDNQVIREGEMAVHDPTGLQGPVVRACMETRTITISVGESATLRDRMYQFSGPGAGWH